jgi:hypothetical protein
MNSQLSSVADLFKVFAGQVATALAAMWVA